MSAAIVDTLRPLSHLGRSELETEIERLRRLNAQLTDNLTATQTRCTDLLLEARALAKLPAVASDALREIVRERERQNEKWHRKYGEWPVSDGIKLAVLVEEVGEIANAMLEGGNAPDDDEHLLEEIIQVGAVAVAWAEVLLAARSAR